MELWRRVLLITSLLSAVPVALCADLSPVILIRYIDFIDKQKHEGSCLGFRLMTEHTA